MAESGTGGGSGAYDTSINVIGGLSDMGDVFQAIDAYFRPDAHTGDLTAQRNEFKLRTKRTRDRVELAVRRGFLRFYNPDHENLFRCIFQSKSPFHEREFALFLQLALNNRLFREISLRVFLPAYFSGRAGLSRDDVIAWLKDSLSRNRNSNLNWSENTVSTLSTKYLNLMAKLNFLEGVRIKSFRRVRPSGESLVLFLYFARLYDSRADILKNEFLPLSFIDPEDIRDRIKKLSLKGFFNVELTGSALKIELIYEYKEICDVLYNGSQAEI